MAKQAYDFDDIEGFWAVVLSIEWKDPWLIGLIFFHIVITLTALLTRNYSNFQVVLFLVLLLLVYFSESINEMAANNWNMFSNQQYFDSKGMFISLVFSVPILLNCMVMVANWLWQSGQLMTRLRLAQLKQAQSKLQQQQQQCNTAGTARPKLD